MGSFFLVHCHLTETWLYSSWLVSKVKNLQTLFVQNCFLLSASKEFSGTNCPIKPKTESEVCLYDKVFSKLIWLTQRWTPGMALKF